MRLLYYHHGECEEAYRWPGQYYFGSDLLAAPVVQTARRTVQLKIGQVQASG